MSLALNDLDLGRLRRSGVLLGLVHATRGCRRLRLLQVAGCPPWNGLDQRLRSSDTNSRLSANEVSPRDAAEVSSTSSSSSRSSGSLIARSTANSLETSDICVAGTWIARVFETLLRWAEDRGSTGRLPEPPDLLILGLNGLLQVRLASATAAVACSVALGASSRVHRAARVISSTSSVTAGRPGYKERTGKRGRYRGDRGELNKARQGKARLLCGDRERRLD